jgi:Protein of unknown function (DUF4058)
MSSEDEIMPLLDHFHAPLTPARHWESFHVNWAGAIADALNERLLPEGHFAEEHTHRGARVEIDGATYEESSSVSSARTGGTVTLPPRTWTPPAPVLVVPAAFPDSFEVLVFESEGGARLVASVELVSPSNKDRPEHRRAFAVKCASYLCQGVGLVVIDIVTSRRANLHNEMMELLGHGSDACLPVDSQLYAVAYRPLRQQEKEQIQVWPETLGVGKPLPTLPLALNAGLALPLDLETTYTTACHRRRLP